MMFNHHSGVSASPDGAFRAWVGDSMESAYVPDLASEIDSEEEILADLLGITPPQALRVLKWHKEEAEKLSGAHREQFGHIIASLLTCQNLAVQAQALALCAGLDQLNGRKSQAEIARELGVTRALVSHYVCAFADILGVEVTKFRKSEGSREKFREAQLNRRRGA